MGSRTVSLIMKPYGGWSFREWKTVEWIFLPQMKIATTWTGIFLITETIMIMIISLWNCFNGFALNSSTPRASRESVECSGRLIFPFTWLISFLIGSLVINKDHYNVCKDIEFQMSESGPVLGRLTVSWSRIHSRVSHSRSFFESYNESNGWSRSLNHVRGSKTSARLGEHRSARSESPQAWTTLNKDGGARRRRYEGQ